MITRSLVKVARWNFKVGSNNQVLSEIIFSGTHLAQDKKIRINSIVDEIKAITKDKKKSLVIKMDIEGAEWRILSDDKVLRALHEANATMLLAVHPGFQRPFKKIAPVINRISLEFWRTRNFLDSYKIFKKISTYGKISRTNLNPLHNPGVFSMLTILGYHEFVIQFGEEK